MNVIVISHFNVTSNWKKRDVKSIVIIALNTYFIRTNLNRVKKM